MMKFVQTLIIQNTADLAKGESYDAGKMEDQKSIQLDSMQWYGHKKKAVKATEYEEFNIS